MSQVWINGRSGERIDHRDRGLQYGDGLFETMRVRERRVRLLELHLERLYEGARRLGIAAPPARVLLRELTNHAARRREAVLKLILTRGVGARGYRPSGREHATRILSLHPLPPLPRGAVRVRMCETRFGANPALAGLKTLNRLESVLARSEWHDARVWEGLMRDAHDHVVGGTMSNLFLRRGSVLVTPILDRCGIAGIMRRWVLEQAPRLRLRALERRVRWEQIMQAEEVFLTNAIAGIVSVAGIRWGAARIEFGASDAAARLRSLLERL